jgi:hypothetical protein
MTRSRAVISRGLVLSAALLLALAPGSPSLSLEADEKKDKRAEKNNDCGPQVRVTIVIILASERDKVVHPKLKCIAGEVRKMYPKLKGFKLHTYSGKSVPVGVAGVFELIERQTTTITVQCGADKKDRIRLKVAPPEMGEITYSTPCGKFLPIVTPYRTRNNELVILAVCVEPCKGKRK